MNEEIPIAYSPPTEAELAAWNKLTKAEIKSIDAVIMSVMNVRWRKVVAVVILVKEALEKDYPIFSICFYAARIEWMADLGKIDSKGDLSYMRFSEVRLLPDPKAA